MIELSPLSRTHFVLFACVEKPVRGVRGHLSLLAQHHRYHARQLARCYWIEIIVCCILLHCFCSQLLWSSRAEAKSCMMLSVGLDL